MSKKFLILVGSILILSIMTISASDVLVWQGQYYTGTTFHIGTYEFNFTVYDNLTEGNICYSNTTPLITGNFGEWKTEQNNVSISCNNASKDYYLNININGTDQVPRKRLIIWNFLRKDVNEVSTGNLILHGVLQGLSPLKLQDEINFIKSNGIVTSALYNAPRGLSSSLSGKFEDSLIHDIIQETNTYGMQECWWDENTKTMQMCISGAYLPQRATTISRSLQIVGNTTSKLINENFTLCEGNDYIDCNTDTTGADLLVEDDIESRGSLFSQENITVKDTGFFTWLGSLTNRITKLFVQNIDISGNLTGITKEIFFPILPSDANLGNFRTQSVTSGGIWRFNFQVPYDFISLVSLEVVLVPVGTNAISPVDLYSNYGAIGEAYTTHSETLSTTWNLDTANNFYAKNISGVFTNLSAGDFCGIQIDEGAFGFLTHYLGIRMKYKT